MKIYFPGNRTLGAYQTTNKEGRKIQVSYFSTILPCRIDITIVVYINGLALTRNSHLWHPSFSLLYYTYGGPITCSSHKSSVRIQITPFPPDYPIPLIYCSIKKKVPSPFSKHNFETTNSLPCPYGAAGMQGKFVIGAPSKNMKSRSKAAGGAPGAIRD